MVIKIGQSSNGPLRRIQVATEALKWPGGQFQHRLQRGALQPDPGSIHKINCRASGEYRCLAESRAAVKAKAQADADIARKTLDSTAAILKQNDAEFGHYRQMERTAKQYGMNISYQDEFARLIRQETEQTNLASQETENWRLQTANYRFQPAPHPVAGVWQEVH